MSNRREPRDQGQRQGYRSEEHPVPRYEEEPNYGSSNRSSSRGARGGRANRGGGFSRDIRKTRNPINTRQTDPEVKPPGLPVGQHLSKTSSDLKNDPLYLESFFPTPSEELVPVAEELNHYTGLHGLTPLINESYENFSAHSLNFKRSVPVSAYAYYISVFSWARLLQVKKLNKYRLSTEEREFLDVIYDQGNFILPKSLSIYLSGIGNFKLPSGVDTKFDLKPYEYNDHGYFENMEDNFISSFYPCISIYAQRITEDLRVTADPAANVTWRPNAIVQAWNNRCLGYSPAVRLQSMQKAIYDNAGITADLFPSDCEVFRINIRLLNAVQKYLSEIPSLESGPVPDSATGSQGQLITEVPEISRIQDYDNIGACNYTSKSPLSVPGPVSYLSGSFLYRIDFDLTAARSRWFFPYTIQAPTAAQIAALNDLNTGLSPIMEGVYHYANVPFKPDLRVKKICSVDIKSSSMK